MNSEEKAKKVLEITKEIEEIERFIGVLKYEIRYGKKNKSLIRKTTTFSFLGVWSRNITTDTPIPENIKIEINALCLIWIDELKRRIEQLIPNNDYENSNV